MWKRIKRSLQNFGFYTTPGHWSEISNKGVQGL